MKKHLIYIIGIAAAFFTACENISEDERFLEVEGVTAQRVVLLEDYTGQACKNCPKAHEKATELHELYPQNFIVVAIHAGMQALPELKIEEGDTYADNAGVKIYPSGHINRRGGLKDYNDWTSTVMEELKRPSNLDVTVSTTVRDGKLHIVTNLLALEHLKGKLQLWILEDNIKTFQLLPDGQPDLEYIHNHVFRGSINGTWGEDISLNLGETKTLQHNDIALKEAWNPANLSVVAFVYNEEGVLQAAQCKATANE